MQMQQSDHHVKHSILSPLSALPCSCSLTRCILLSPEPAQGDFEERSPPPHQQQQQQQQYQEAHSEEAPAATTGGEGDQGVCARALYDYQACE